MSLIGIAAGAVKVGQKIFQGIKKRKEKKIEKLATKIADQRSTIAKVNSIATPGIFASQGDNTDALASLKSLINPSAGLQSISSAANNLQDLKGGAEEIQPTAANVALQERASGAGPVNPMLLIGGAFILILLFISKKR
jgi:hypothetical protein